MDVVSDHSEDSRALRAPRWLSDAPAAHVDQAEREVLQQALAAIVSHLGPAARVVDGGPFVGLRTQMLCERAERLKSVVLLDSDASRLDSTIGRLRSALPDAELHILGHSVLQQDWNLPPMASGKTLVSLLTGAYDGFAGSDAQAFWTYAAANLSTGDLVLITTELMRDTAELEALYQGFAAQVVRSGLVGAGGEPLVIAHAKAGLVRFGCLSEAGAWREAASVRLMDARTVCAEASGFEAVQEWTSQDRSVQLVLMQRT